MGIKANVKKVYIQLKKYKYALLILAIGLLMMSLPSAQNETNSNLTQVSDVEHTEPTLEEKLEVILQLVEGAGDVRVILSVAAGEEIVYQTNDNVTSSNDSNSKNIDTVTVTDAQRNQTGLISQINPVIYRGVIIVCQGADDPVVRLNIVDAVSKLTGIGANQISVLKMK